jgi:ATP-binding cassette subfamily B protein
VIAAALERLQKGRTLVAIAHRLATVRAADRVLSIDNGRLVGEGPPATIVAGHGADLDLEDVGGVL